MRQPYMEMIINDTQSSGKKGIALRSLGEKVPSPLVSIQFTDAENALQSNFTVTLHISGNQNKGYHVGTFEMLLYAFAQMQGGSILPCYIELGWAEDEGIAVDDDGRQQLLSIQGQFIKFKSTVKNSYMEYVLTGVGNFTATGNNKGLYFPAVKGNYRPSDTIEDALNFIQAYTAFDYDIDHDDEVVPMYLPAAITSLYSYVYGDSTRAGIIQQAYCAGSRSTAYRLPGRLSSGMYSTIGLSHSQIRGLLGAPVAVTQRSASSYSFSITEPTFHKRGVIRFKNNTNLANYANKEILLYGAQNANVLSLTASYDGYTQQLYGSGASVQTGVGIDIDGNLLTTESNRSNSYSASAPSMYAAGNVINNLNAISTQFNTDIQATIVGNPKLYKIAEKVRLVVFSRGTLNPITGQYRVVKVTHTVTGTSYQTVLGLKRLDPITANNVVSSIAGDGDGTPNINGSTTAALHSGKPRYAVPYQSVMNLLRRGVL